MSDAFSFGKLVPGFDFLQGLMKNAAGAVPAMGQWIAPTLNPEELEKRIADLKAVKFWLEQNSRMLDATIQALEVQRMTLSTLQTMNVKVGDLRDALGAKVPSPAPAPEPEPEPVAAKPRRAPARKAAGARGGKSAATLPGSVIDPMQWWGAVSKQFGDLATQAIKDGGTDMARNLASGMLKPAAAPKAKAAAAKPKRAR